MAQEVKAKMILKGISQARIADDLGITPGTVSAVVNKKRTSKRVQKAIAEALGEQYERVWGKAA